MMTAQESAELCEGIVEVLEERGHCKGRYQDASGQVCLYGAGRVVQVGAAEDVCRAVVCNSIECPTGIADTKTRKALQLEWVHRFNDYGVDSNDRVLFSNGRADFSKGLNKETAIEYAMKQAKYWREQG
jgi:hypothetical protein